MIQSAADEFNAPIMNLKTELGKVRIWTTGVALCSMLAGCAHHREFSGAEQRAMATPPAFLTGSMALVLTNGRSYSAQIVFETKTVWGSTQAVSGNFAAAGTKLAFEPELTKSARKNAQAKMVFVWDTVQSSGYALNDALQGYAPFSGPVRFTNIVAGKQNTAPQQLLGHECEEETVIVNGEDGSINRLQVWRATDLRGFPLRIVSGDTNSSSLTFSKIQFGPPTELLMSSEGFTKYESPEAMVTELVARQHNLSRRSEAASEYPANLQHQPPRPGQSY